MAANNLDGPRLYHGWRYILRAQSGLTPGEGRVRVMLADFSHVLGLVSAAGYVPGDWLSQIWRI